MSSFPTQLTAQGLLADDVERMRDGLKPLRDELRGKRLLISGATGFFGKWLLVGLSELNRRDNVGLEVLALSRSPERFLKQYPAFEGLPGVRFVAADVATFAEPLPSTDLAIHAATEAGTAANHQNPVETLETTVIGTRRVLAALQQAGVKRVLTTSSGAVYGKQPSELTHVSEAYLGAPDCMSSANVYGEGKRVAETFGVVTAEQHGFDFISARCFAFIGPYLPLDVHFAAGNFIRDALGGGPIVIGGDGTPQRSYLYAGDLVVWLVTMLLRGVSGRAYNVGSDQNVSIEALARRMAALTGTPVEVTVKTAADPSKPVLRYVPNINRAKSELGLEVRTSLDESISRMLTTLRAWPKR